MHFLCFFTLHDWLSHFRLDGIQSLIAVASYGAAYMHLFFSSFFLLPYFALKFTDGVHSFT